MREMERELEAGTEPGTKIPASHYHRSQFTASHGIVLHHTASITEGLPVAFQPYLQPWTLLQDGSYASQTKLPGGNNKREERAGWLGSGEGLRFRQTALIHTATACKRQQAPSTHHAQNNHTSTKTQNKPSTTREDGSV